MDSLFLKYVGVDSLFGLVVVFYFRMSIVNCKNLLRYNRLLKIRVMVGKLIRLWICLGIVERWFWWGKILNIKSGL